MTKTCCRFRNLNSRTSPRGRCQQRLEVVLKSTCQQMSNERCRRNRKLSEKRFEAAISWIGMGVVILFVLWTFAMVLLQAWEQWRR